MRLRLGIGVIILLVGVLATMKINRSTQEMQTRFAISHEPHPQDDLSAREHALREMGWKEPVVVPVDDLLASDDLMFILRGLDAHYDAINEEVWQETKGRDFPSDEERNKVLAEETAKRFAPFIPVFVRAADNDLVELKPGSFRPGISGDALELASFRWMVRAVANDALRAAAIGDNERAEHCLISSLSLSHYVAKETQDQLVFLMMNGAITFALDSIEQWQKAGKVPPDSATRLASHVEQIGAAWMGLAKQALIQSAEADMQDLESVLGDAALLANEDPDELE